MFSMKKKAVLLLCAATMVNTSVYATNIDARVDFRKVEISVTDTKEVEIPTIQILNKQKTKVLYTDEGIRDGKEYKFDNFTFPSDESTGEYIIRIGENGVITEKTVKYLSFDDIKNAIMDLKECGGDVFSALIRNAEVFSTSESELNALNNDWKARLKNEILSLNLDYSSDDKVKESFRNTVAVIGKIFNYSDLINSANSTKIDTAVGNMNFLDLKYWNNLTDKLELYYGFSAQNIDELSADDQKVSFAFDGAMLTAVINTMDWGMGKDALNYYCQKGILSLDSKYLNGDSSLYKALKNKKIRNYNDIPGALDEISQQTLPENQYTNNDAGGVAGGGFKTPTTGNNIDGAFEAKRIFNDLNGYEWASEAINELYNKGIVSGKGDGIYAPQDNITRAEFVKIIVSAFNLLDTNAFVDFEDVPSDSWSYSYIASAKKAGIIYGIDDRYFGANNQMSRQDMAVIVSRVMDLVYIPYSNGSIAFNDSYVISDYAREAVMKLASSGIVNGMGDGNFSPNTNVTRAQAAQVIYGVLKKQNN